jgi:hypothetical protein
MRSFRSSGSVEGVMGNRHPYSDAQRIADLQASLKTRFVERLR